MKKKPISVKKRQAKQEAYHVLSKLYNYLKYEDIHIKFHKFRKGLCGTYDPYSDEIELDYRKDLISTLIHETIHKIYPNWSETKVYRYEAKIMNTLSIHQIKNVIRALSNSI